MVGGSTRPHADLLSFPAKQIVHGHQVDGALVAWVDSTTLPDRYESLK
ncbi:MAG: hypothetical protein ACQET4_12240 [Pseudomonadota bacterium]